MSALTLFADSSIAIPDYLKHGGADDLTKSLAGGSSTHSISIKGGVFRMVVGSEEVARNENRSMDIIIANASQTVHRMYYNEEYEEGKVISPVCYSSNGQTPDPKSKAQQAPSCNGCPQNVAGSGQGDSRACRFSRKLAVLLPHDVDGPAYRLTLPAKSIFGKAVGDKMPLEAYAKFLAGHGLKVSAVVTEMRFDTTQAVPVLTFRAKRPLTAEEYGTVQARQQDPEMADLVALTFAEPKEDVAPAPVAAPAPAPVAAPVTRKPRAAAPAPAPVAPAPAVADELVDEPAPVVRAAKPAPAAPAATNQAVLDVLSAWGTDDDE